MTTPEAINKIRIGGVGKGAKEKILMDCPWAGTQFWKLVWVAKIMVTCDLPGLDIIGLGYTSWNFWLFFSARPLYEAYIDWTPGQLFLSSLKTAAIIFLVIFSDGSKPANLHTTRLLWQRVLPLGTLDSTASTAIFTGVIAAVLTSNSTKMACLCSTIYRASPKLISHFHPSDR